MLKTLKDTRSAKLVLGTIDYACMFLGKVECNLVTSALHAKAKQNPKEFEKLAGDQKALDAFVEGVTGKKASGGGARISASAGTD